MLKTNVAKNYQISVHTTKCIILEKIEKSCLNLNLLLDEFKFETCLKLAARIGLTLQLTILEKIWRNQSKNQNIAQWLIFLILKHVETRNKKNLIEIETVERSRKLESQWKTCKLKLCPLKVLRQKSFERKRNQGLLGVLERISNQNFSFIWWPTTMWACRK